MGITRRYRELLLRAISLVFRMLDARNYGYKQGFGADHADDLGQGL